MATVLILQELAQNIEHIKEALEPRGHKLVFVNEPEMALRLLGVHKDSQKIIERKEKAGAMASEATEPMRFDAVICAVYLEESDVFEFVRKVKRSDARKVPIVFYCYKTSTFARSVRSALKIAARSTGVDFYITMESFVASEFAGQFEQCLFPASDRLAALQILDATY